MQLLRDLWRYIDPTCAIADDRVSKKESEGYIKKEARRLASAVGIAKNKVERLRQTGRLHQVKGGFRSFCERHNILLT
jgi:hypothetical protein